MNYLSRHYVWVLLLLFFVFLDNSPGYFIQDCTAWPFRVSSCKIERQYRFIGTDASVLFIHASGSDYSISYLDCMAWPFLVPISKQARG